MAMKVNEQENINNLADCLRKRYNAQGADYGWHGKPEGSPAATKYPNLVAETVFSRIWLEYIANAANISMEIMTAVAEDGEEMSYMELKRVVQWMNMAESPDYRVSFAYLSSPALSYIDSGSHKGRWRLRQLETLYETARSVGKDYRFLLDLMEEQTQSLIADMKAGAIVYYASYRAVASVLTDAIRAQEKAHIKQAAKCTKRRDDNSVNAFGDD